jgi:hypothetical protein
MVNLHKSADFADKKLIKAQSSGMLGEKELSARAENSPPTPASSGRGNWETSKNHDAGAVRVRVCGVKC